MAMRDIPLGVRFPFSTENEQYMSEDLLLKLMAFIGCANLHYLRQHPETKNLYDSGVVYAVPDQADGREINETLLRQLTALLQKMKLDPETVVMIYRMVQGIEIFLDIPSLYRRGKGDCNELAPVRLAELWRAGIAASPYLTKRPNQRNGLTYHALVLWPDGSSEDPSLILGMGGEARAADRAEEIRKNHERKHDLIVAANTLLDKGEASPSALVEHIDMMGLVPRKGFGRANAR